MSGSIEEKIGDPDAVNRIERTLRECRALATGDFQLSADIDDAIRELRAAS